MINRLQLHSAQKTTFDVMATYFDMALKKLLESYGGVKYGATLWYEEVKSYCGCVLDSLDLKVLFDCKGNFDSHADVVERVYLATKTGQLLCASAMRKHQQAEVVAIAEQVSGPLRTAAWDENVMSRAMLEFTNKLTAAGVSQSVLPEQWWKDFFVARL